MMRLILLIPFVALAAAIDLSGEHKSYSGYKVLEVVPTTQQQADDVHALSRDPQIDFWTEWRGLNLPIRMMLPPTKIGHTIDYIEDHGMDFKIINHDVGIEVEAELSRLRSRDAGHMAFNISAFNTYDDIMTELDAMAARCPAALTCTVETLGQSYEGRDIKVLRISAGVATTGYWLDSAIHAREWLAPATVLKVMDHFTRDYGSDSNVTDLIDSYNWHFVPVVNPDGYEFSWTDDRMWRKSRNANPESLCLGTDLNRNFDSHWSSDGTSANPCADDFHGAGPASELETQTIQSELARLGSSGLQGIVSVHTAAQMWLHPWGYQEAGECARTADYDNLFQVVNAAADATENTYGTRWTRGTICETIYPASGGTIDFAREGPGIVYNYTPELRGPGFITDPDQIEPSFQEFYNGVKAMVAEIETISSPK